jgi:hypothetical protein
MPITLNGSTGIDSPGGDVSVSQGLSGNLAFTGTGNRITGDFSNATPASRLALQSSTTNGITAVNFIPNGTGTISSLLAFSNSSAADCSFGQLRVENAGDVRLVSGVVGSGTNLPMTFYTGGSEAMRIDTSRNVGIGVTPSAWQSGILAIDTGSVGCFFAGSTSTNLATNAFLATGGWTYKTTNFATRYATTTTGQHQWFNAPSGTAGNAISFTQAMTLDASGNLMVGTTSSSQRLNVLGSSASAFVVRFSDDRGDGASGAGMVEFFRTSGVVGSITTSTTATSYNTSSDYRLKHDIQPLTGALEKVAALKPCTYTWKADGSDGQGFIAHELQEVVPDCVTGTKDAVDKDGKPQYQGVDTSFLVATLVAALQEQQALIQDLTTRLTALEGN